MKKLLTYLACICLTLSITLSFPLQSQADFGDFSGDTDYGWDSGSDWGGDSDYSWDWGSNDDNNDNDYYVGGTTYDDHDDGDGFLGAVTIIAVIVIVVLIAKSATKGHAPTQSTPSGGAKTDSGALKPMVQYKDLDEKFDQGAFCEKLSNLYVQMQESWTARDIEPVRPYFTDAYWSQMDRQLQAMKQKRRTGYTERIAVLSVTPRGFYQSGGEDHIIVELRTRIVAYTLDDKTGAVVSGSQTAEKFMTYEWDLTRPSGILTQEQDEMTTVNCPNCGAPVSINASAKCPYCDSVITLEDHNWALCSIKGISQKTK